MKSIVNFILFLGWVLGVILAKGFWSTLFAFFMPFWAWYLTVEHYFL